MVWFEVLTALAVAIATSFVLMRACQIQRITQPTMVSAAFGGFMATHFLPAVVFRFDHTMTQSNQFLLANCVAIVTFAMGVVFANLMMRMKVDEIDDFYRACLAGRPSFMDRVAVLTFGLICVFVLAAYIHDVPSYPLYLMFSRSASSQSINLLRRDVTGSTMGSPLWYLYSLSRVFFMPLLFISIIALWKSLRGWLEKAFGVACILVVLIFNSWSASKTSVALLFVLATFFLLMRLNEVPDGSGAQLTPAMRLAASRRRWRLVLGIFGVGSLVVVYPLVNFMFRAFGQHADIPTILYEGIFKRIFATPAMLSYRQFQMFPTHFDFTNFRDVRKFASVFGLEYFDLSEATAIFQGSGANSNAPPSTLGNFWAQGGWPVIMLGFFFVGVIFQSLQLWVFRSAPRSRLTLGIVALLMWGAFRINMQGFHTVMLSEAIIPASVMLIVWRIVRTPSPSLRESVAAP
jgi:hypothetical protein